LFVAVRVNCTQAIKDLLNSSQADQDVRTGRAVSHSFLIPFTELIEIRYEINERVSLSYSALHSVAFSGRFFRESDRNDARPCFEAFL